MAETLIEEKIIRENTVENSPKARLEKFLQENNVKVFTEKDFDFPKDEEAQSKIRAEVDEFMRMREKDKELLKGREEL